MKTFEIRQTRTYTTHIEVEGNNLQEVEERLHNGDYDDELAYQELEQMNTDDHESDVYEIDKKTGKKINTKTD